MHFESVYRPDAPTLDTSVVSQCNSGAALISIPRMYTADVNLTFKKLKRSIVPDSLPGYVFRGYGDSFSMPLLFIFNLSQAKGVYPIRSKVTSLCRRTSVGPK